MDDLRNATESHLDAREAYVAPHLVEIGSLVELTATDHYSLITSGEVQVLSSVTG
jgi:hypothetical protein